MQMPDRHTLNLTVPRLSRLTWLGIAATLISTGGLTYSYFRFADRSSTDSSQQQVDLAAQPVTALGYLQPSSEGVIQVTAPTTTNRAVIDQLLVSEGDRVQAGQDLAILSTHEAQLAAVETAAAQIEIVQAQLAQVQAGEERGDIQAQAAAVTSAEAQLADAQTEYARYEFLYEQGAISAEERDRRLLSLQTAEANLQQQQETLRSLEAVRPEDIQIAAAQLANAIAQRDEAIASLALTSIQAPRAGEIIRINTQPGELVGEGGVLDLGQTDQMYVSAEVYQSDIDRVRIGQEARITGDAFAGALMGTVSQIGREVRGQSVQDADPLADVDARVVEVKIQLNPPDSEKVSGLTNLQVQVTLAP